MIYDTTLYIRVKFIRRLVRQYTPSPSCFEEGDVFLKNVGAMRFMEGIKLPSLLFKEQNKPCTVRLRWIKEFLERQMWIHVKKTKRTSLFNPACDIQYTLSTHTGRSTHSLAVGRPVSRMTVEPSGWWGVNSPLHNKIVHVGYMLLVYNQSEVMCFHLHVQSERRRDKPAINV